MNVHPAKTEVRFRNAGLVRALLVHALKAALTRKARAQPQPAAARPSRRFDPNTVRIHRPGPRDRGEGAMTGGVHPLAQAICAAQVHFRPAAALPRRLQRRSMWALQRFGIEASLAEIGAASGAVFASPEPEAIGIRSAPPAHKYTRPTSLHKPATGSSSSMNTPPMSVSFTRN